MDCVVFLGLSARSVGKWGPFFFFFFLGGGGLPAQNDSRPPPPHLGKTSSGCGPEDNTISHFLHASLIWLHQAYGRTKVAYTCTHFTQLPCLTLQLTMYIKCECTLSYDWNLFTCQSHVQFYILHVLHFLRIFTSTPGLYTFVIMLRGRYHEISAVENQKGAITIPRCSVENQKGAITIPRCSVENQKGTIAVQSLWR